MFNLPQQVTFLLNKLNSEGYEAYIVGGCVRDFLLCKIPNDFDICTSATPEQIMEVFKGHNFLTVGLKHGTVTIVLDKKPYEITTYRIDKDYTDNRHPDTVVFTKNLVDDLARRDFTINAMAYNNNHGLVDVFSGRKDLAANIIRTVGDPQTRFDEDALRILRALRFAATLNFKIEKNTAKAILKNRYLVSNISKERITEEFKKLICGKMAGMVFENFSEIFSTIMPPFDPCNKQKSFIRTVFDNCPSDICIRLATIFDFKEDIVEALNYLRLDKATSKKAISLVENKRVKIYATKIDIKLALCRLGKDLFLDLLEIQKPIALYSESEYLNLYNLTMQILNNNECYCIDMLDITGDDLIANGVPKGVAVGKRLEFILESVIYEKVENNKTKIIRFLKEIHHPLTL